MRGDGGFTDCDILENGSLPSPFGEVLSTEMGDIGIVDGGGLPALDTPYEGGKDKRGAGDEVGVTRFTVSKFPWADWSGWRPNCLMYWSHISEMVFRASGGNDACPIEVTLSDGTSVLASIFSTS